MQRFLFDRLCEPLKAQPMSVEEKIDELKLAIENSLQQLFCQKNYFLDVEDDTSTNVTKFSASDLRGFGLYDLMSNGVNSESIYALTKHIKKIINTYEPRLKEVAVIWDGRMDSAMKPHFRIEGKIALEHVTDDFLWMTVFN